MEIDNFHPFLEGVCALVRGIKPKNRRFGANFFFFGIFRIFYSIFILFTISVFGSLSKLLQNVLCTGNLLAIKWITEFFLFWSLFPWNLHKFVGKKIFLERKHISDSPNCCPPPAYIIIICCLMHEGSKMVFFYPCSSKNQ